jgi:hypothetical protein
MTVSLGLGDLIGIVVFVVFAVVMTVALWRDRS